ncbi:hypothetical protein C8D87_105600 [Lentzea atacamensis]|uniref:Uncharacterized protein n=1 Tax=Lentzea atacamensis TaxID=531938 RepID=A0ABX9E6U2_9PSEU|nr:hypothetical protein [Lentzea atacamensis]RAS65105.1 hypothetical protein C8D87_105600 [Lentzea atacamensis]
MNEQISRQLRESAEAHRPDRARMLARVERGMATTTRPSSGRARSWSKVTFAGATAAGILAAAGLAVAVVGTSPPPPDTMLPGVSNTSSAPPTTSSVVRPPAANQPDPPVTTRVPEVPDSTGSRPTDGPLSSKGTVDPNSHTFWSQDTLVIGTTQRLTALTVQVRIAQTGGVQSSGHWQTMPADDFTITVGEADGELVYRWDLKPGRTVPAGQHAFAVQFNQTRGARDAKDDRYGVMAGSHAVWGGFERG